MIRDILRDLGLAVPSAPGVYRTTCPACSATRRKTTERCVKVEVTTQHVKAWCHHCQTSQFEEVWH